MSQVLKYFLIPFENVPANPTYVVWFATWSREPPALEPGMNSPMVVGATPGDLPGGAVLLGSAIKDPQPPPPPPPPSFTESDYQRTVGEWLAIGKDADE